MPFQVQKLSLWNSLVQWRMAERAQQASLFLSFCFRRSWPIRFSFDLFRNLEMRFLHIFGLQSILNLTKQLWLKITVDLFH